MKIAVHGLTQRAAGLVNEIASDVVITNPSADEEAHRQIKCSAVWDTGATGTVISERVAEALQIPAVSAVVANTANGEYLTTTHYVDLLLPNQVEIKGIFVTKGNFGPNANYDVLIGMDIITLGDFAISNFNKQTMFSFRMPSIEHIDFKRGVEIHNPVKVGRNVPCPCGSGKKYKHCCGK